VFVAEMLDYVLTQIITNGVWIPAGVSWSGFSPRADENEPGSIWEYPLWVTILLGVACCRRYDEWR
jgi:hypothetical protein